MHQYTVQFAKKAHLIARRYSHSWILSGEYFVYNHSSVKGNLLTNLSWPSALQWPTDRLEARCGCSLSRNYWKKVLGYVVPQIRLYQLDADAVSCKKFQQRQQSKNDHCHGGEVILHVALSLDVFTSLEDTAELSGRTVCVSQSTHTKFTSVSLTLLSSSSSSSHGAGWSVSNALDVYFEYSQFKFWLGHWLFRLKFFVLFLYQLRQVLGWYLD